MFCCRGNLNPIFPNRSYTTEYSISGNSFGMAFWLVTEAPHQVNSEDFSRQAYIGAFFAERRVIALHAHSFFDLSFASNREHSYFSRYFTPKAWEGLRQRQSRKVMTMEQFSVDPEWRFSQQGVSLAAVMSGLAMKIATAHPIDTILAVARADVGIAQLGWSQGAVSLDSGVRLHNTPCELLAFNPQTMQLPPGEEVRNLISNFWKKRIDLCSEPKREPKLRSIRRSHEGGTHAERNQREAA